MQMQPTRDVRRATPGASSGHGASLLSLAPAFLAVLTSWCLTLVRPQDFLAHLALVLSFAVIYCFRVARRPAVVWSAWFVWLAHVAVAVVNAYFFSTPGADADARGFHNSARVIAGGRQNIEHSEMLYVQMLALAYRLFGSSVLVGSSLSLAAVTITLAMLARLADPTGQRRREVTLILAFGLPPSVIFFTSVTLRESFQALASIGAVYGALALRSGARMRGICALGASVILLVQLHNGLAVFGLAVILLSLAWGSGMRVSMFSLKRVGAMLLAGLIVLGAQAWMSESRGALGALLSGRVFDYVRSYRAGAMSVDARANYGIDIDPAQPAQILTKLPQILFYYMFAPLPWQVSTAMDAGAFVESVLRFCLLSAAIVHWRRSAGEVRARMLFILLLYFLQQALWALGTQNWGTALRHHVPAYPLLVLTGAVPLANGVAAVVRYVCAPPRSAYRRRSLSSAALESKATV